jgi:hypothetical protein
MSDLAKFLHETYSKPCHERPFVCDGLPQSCNVIVIGENPATKLDVDWWSFWSDAKGFDLAKFEKHYQETRRNSGKDPVSKTRGQLNRLRSSGLNCLETNAFSNERPKGRGVGISNEDLLPVLIRSLPRLVGVIAHGKVAERTLDRLSLAPNVKPYRLKHLIYVGHSDLHQLAEELLQLAK